MNSLWALRHIMNRSGEGENNEHTFDEWNYELFQSTSSLQIHS